MPHNFTPIDISTPNHSPLLDEYLEPLRSNIKSGPIIDIACGGGRNGLFLARQGLPVVFADRSQTALKKVTETKAFNSNNCRAWAIDLEQPDQNPLNQQTFSAAIIFRYLHRPLFPAILNSIAPGGFVIYETFTENNVQFGRPNNPAFLLKNGELRSYFEHWDILHYFEGFVSNPDRAIAQIVCRKYHAKIEI